MILENSFDLFHPTTKSTKQSERRKNASQEQAKNVKKMICKKKQVNSSLSQFVVRKKSDAFINDEKYFRDERKICSCTRQKKRESLTIIIDVQGEISGG